MVIVRLKRYCGILGLEENEMANVFTDAALALLVQLRHMKLLSKKSLMEAFGYDYEKEAEVIRQEEIVENRHAFDVEG